MMCVLVCVHVLCVTLQLSSDSRGTMPNSTSQPSSPPEEWTPPSSYPRHIGRGRAGGGAGGEDREDHFSASKANHPLTIGVLLSGASLGYVPPYPLSTSLSMFSNGITAAYTCLSLICCEPQLCSLPDESLLHCLWHVCGGDVCHRVHYCVCVCVCMLHSHTPTHSRSVLRT